LAKAKVISLLQCYDICNSGDKSMEQKAIPDIFISYSRKDIAFARLIRESLMQSGFDVWIDWDRIPTGIEFMPAIETAIQSANTFLFIISQTSINSEMCKSEISLALQNNKRIIPVIVDNLSQVRMTAGW
jgi:hypothetical protein